jgi:capsular polysaccharide export protein
MKIIGDIEGSKILFLQGPMGTFFRKLSGFFTNNGATTYTICFNAGDFLFAGKKNRSLYTGTREQWRKYIHLFLNSHSIDKIFLFGNCRYYHREAITVAKEMSIDVFVFEEGYIRPNYITLEKFGVNGDSSLPQNPEFYSKLIPEKIEPAPSAENSYSRMALQATIYYIANALSSPFLRHYIHHRDPSVFKEFCYGLRNVIRRFKYQISEKDILTQLQTQLKKKYYFVPLQTRTDFQLTEYSDFPDIESFIRDIIISFTLYSPPDTYLVIKHHPMERGMSTYLKYIERLCHEHNLSDRVIVIFDVHLPTCLKNAIGTVTINSTVGLSSLFHRTPTLVLGRAVYDIKGLTCCGMSLDTFWKGYHSPDRHLFLKFKNYVINETQLSGGFYGRFPDFADQPLSHCYPIRGVKSDITSCPTETDEIDLKCG